MVNATSEQIPLAIKAQDIRKRVDVKGQPLEILRGLDLEIKQGESLAIVGRSGSGKTTLLGLLAGLDQASAGTIELMGQELGAMTEDERADLRARHVGFVFQSFHLLPALTALENVMLPIELKGHQQAEDQARSFLSYLGLEDRLGHYPSQLSGGEQQRVALARAFACQPAILFADEPTGNLDTETGSQIIDAMFELNQQENTTLIMVTHDVELAARCDRTIHITEGHLLDSPEIATSDFTASGGHTDAP